MIPGHTPHPGLRVLLCQKPSQQPIIPMGRNLLSWADCREAEVA